MVALSRSGQRRVTRITPSPWQNWQALHFHAEANDPDIAGYTSDPDRDRVSNLVEYAMAMNPTANDLVP